VAAQDAYQIDPDHLVFIDTHKEKWAQVKVLDIEPSA